MSVPETPYTRGEMYLSAIADGDSGGIPERPYTRKEMYLDAIARGDTSGIPERPYTREEMYLDAIAKNGGGGGGGGSSSLSGLTDVDISNPADGQTLVYNATSGKWENGAGSGILVITVGDTLVMDRTWNEIKSAGFAVVITNMVEDNRVTWNYVIACEEYEDEDNATTYYNVFLAPIGDRGELPAPILFRTDSPNGYPTFYREPEP